MQVMPCNFPTGFSDHFRYICIRGHIGSVLLFSALGLSAQENQFERQVVVESLPVPDEPKQLFYLQRDPDENTVVYQLNAINGTVDASAPVNVYWIRYAEGGEQKKLNFIQRTMAYGISHKQLENGDFKLHLAAYKSLPLWLTYREEHKKYVVLAEINGRDAILDRIFVRISGGSALDPDIAYFELSGRDLKTDAPVKQRIKP
ncbi:DUF4833 domain-containing protein [Parapedobacter lycopersici]|uniref:DUF4833 domain-containing protein n=1 Tax=Parapedobacter lycopersici TaxID=1864939 RepID=UPI00333E5BBD